VSVPTTNSVATFYGNGSTGPFTFNFKFFADADINAVRTDAAGVVNTLYSGAGYSLTGAGNESGGAMTLDVPLESGETLTIYRVVPLTQDTILPDNGPFFASTHERAFDKMVMMSQQLAEDDSRTIRLPITETGNMILPTVPARASKVYGFDATGAVAMYDPGGTPYLLNLGTPVGNYVSLNAAVAALGSTQSTLLVNEPCVMTSNLTVPDNINILWVRGGMIDRQGYTLSGLKVARPQMFGALADGSNDDTAAIQAALDSGASVVRFSPGTYSITSALSLAKSGGTIELIGEGEVIIDGSSISGNCVLLTITGTAGASASPTVAVAMGATTLTCALDADPGDVLVISSDNEVWSPVRAEYLKGEMAAVKTNSGGVITLQDATYDSYTGDAHTTVTKINAPTVRMENLTFRRSSTDVATKNNFGLRLIWCRHSTLKNVRSEYSNYAGITLQQCYNTVADNCGNLGNFVSTQGTDYGLLISSSHIVRVNGGHYIAGRHGISHGGTFPCRDSIIRGAFCDNDPSVIDTNAVVMSFDSHANCQGLKVLGCTFGNGAYIGAADAMLDGNTIYTKTPNGANDKVSLEIGVGHSSAYIDVRNNRIFPVTGKRGIYIHNDVSGDITVQALVVSNNYIQTTTQEGIYIASVNTTGNALTINQLIMSDNNVSVQGTDIPALAIQGGTSNTLSIGTAQILSGRYYSDAGKGLNIASTNTVIDSLSIKDAFVSTNTAAKYPLSIGMGASSGDVIMTGNNISGGNRAYIDTYGTVVVRHNTFSNMTYSLAFNGSSSNCVKLLIGDNIDRSASGIYGAALLQCVGFTQSGPDNGGQRSTAWTGTAAPALGAWNLGDRAIRVPPASGQPKAWSCTTAGGSYSTTRANLTAYAKNAWALWTTGTTVWRCTTAGTSDAAAPDITGKVVGDTVTDGTVVWTLMSLTSATWVSEGNL
jgi:hypothetical protein